jgi:hypothetical protein
MTAGEGVEQKMMRQKKVEKKPRLSQKKRKRQMRSLTKVKN